MARDGAGAEPDAQSVSAESVAVPPGPGESRATAIEVCLPRGQVAYLTRLRCAGEAAPAFERIGLDGYRSARIDDEDYRLSAQQVSSRRALQPGEKDLHPVDRYAVTCPGGEARGLYLDMYHCDESAAPTEAPTGFTLAPVAPVAPAPER